MEYLLISISLLVAIFFILIAMYMSFILSFKNSKNKKILPYECGEHTIGPSWIKFNAGFYTFGLIFLLFDIETVFLIPWTLVLKEVGIIGFIEIIIFVSILILGLIYAWAKGSLEWKS